MNSSKIEQKMEKTRIVPVIALENAADAADLCGALEEGGLEVAEITFRTEAAAEILKIVARDFPAFMLGAGTVTTEEEVAKAKDAGAQFAVSPGLNFRIVRKALDVGLPFFPPAIKMIYGPYRHKGIRFVPTGGIGADNMREYLRTPGVLAIGGSWLVSKELLRTRDWKSVARLTREAVEIVRSL